MINLKTAAAASAIVLIASAASTPAASSKLARHMPGHNTVNVNVSVNMEIPLADDDTQTIAAAQVDGRKILYRLATTECPVLLETIAETCRLTNLNVSTQIRRQNAAKPISLYVSGNAQFAVSLKPEGEMEQ
ncbi:MAG: hypothetical protein HKN11_00805 [Rhizobiales bacterium]|nr:hypothetical protein [Hyphomicrobiales bacterium]